MEAQQEFCTFYLGDLFFGVEVKKVQEVLRNQATTPVPLAPAVIGGLINLRGQIVTAIDLRLRLGLPRRAGGTQAMNVVVRGDDGAVSLLVDEIGDVVAAGDDEFEPSPETLQGEVRQLIEGVYKLKDRLLHVLCLEKAVRVHGGEGSAADAEWRAIAPGKA